MTGDDVSTKARIQAGNGTGEGVGTDVAGDLERSISSFLAPDLGRGENPPEAVLSEVVATLLDGTVEDVDIDEALASRSLDGLLTALIALRQNGTHGTGLMDEIDSLFDVDPSPGTVYPRLHELEEEGTLTRYDLVQTKQYAIEDEAAAAELLEDAMYQHLVLGLFLKEARESMAVPES